MYKYKLVEQVHIFNTETDSPIFLVLFHGSPGILFHRRHLSSSLEVVHRNQSSEGVSWFGTHLHHSRHPCHAVLH